MKKKNIEANWLESYNAVSEYIKAQNCDVFHIPKTVTDNNGEILLYWVYRQIRNYSGYGEENLSDEQKKLLTNIGMQGFLSPDDQKWYTHLEELARFYEQHHHYVIPEDCLCADGTKLKFWLMTQKAAFMKGSLRDDRVQAIAERGLIGMMDSKTEIAVRHLETFYDQNGHADVPADYVCEDGLKLGRAVRTFRTQKNKGELSQEIIDRLDALGMIWDKFDHSWNESYEICKEYHARYGNLDFTEGFTEQRKKKMITWLQANRFKYQHGELSQERIGLLYSIGALDVSFFPQRRKHTEFSDEETNTKVRKDKTLRVRMTESEFDSIIEKAKANGYKSISDYVRSIILYQSS